ncbi:MAG TPA: phage holin family protein [Solirubrobacteraceae bacterium]|nr:phage holin family protein [Solirubrobacteraceae bacterium]
MTAGRHPAAQAREPVKLSRADHAPSRRPGQTRRIRLHRAPLRVIAARIVVNGLAVALVVLVLPGVRENTQHPVLGYLALGAIFGLINAFVKPAMQFVAVPGLLGSLGLVIILIDILTFWLFDLTTRLLNTSGPVAVVAAGVLLGLLSWVLDNLLGLAPPIARDHPQGERG